MEEIRVLAALISVIALISALEFFIISDAVRRAKDEINVLYKQFNRLEKEVNEIDRKYR